MSEYNQDITPYNRKHLILIEYVINMLYFILLNIKKNFKKICNSTKFLIFFEIRLSSENSGN